MITFHPMLFLGDNFDIILEMPETEREELFRKSCEYIENTFSDSAFLRRYDWLGEQAFYNDVNQTWERGSRDHLCDQFIVEYSHGQFEVSNTKYVSSSSGKNFNLFEDLLWPGFGPYQASRTRIPMSREKWAYMTRTKAGLKRASDISYAGNLMTFYYRYLGKTFYNLPKRGGMDTSLVIKFHLYVEDAIREGIKRAIREEFGEVSE